jgi:hypothetical protein
MYGASCLTIDGIAAGARFGLADYHLQRDIAEGDALMLIANF